MHSVCMYVCMYVCMKYMYVYINVLFIKYTLSIIFIYACKHVLLCVRVYRLGICSIYQFVYSLMFPRVE